MTDIKNLEKTLWTAADKMRSNMDAAEYKHVVLGLIFLKYISDAFSELFDKLKEGKGEYEGANPEDPDEYLANNIFFVPGKARWQFLQDKAKQPTIGKLIDEAMDAIEKQNSSLKGILPKIYADPELNKQRLGELIDLIGTIGFNQTGHKAKDLLGRVYEYFLGQFADAEGKKGGQFYTPESIVKLLVQMLEPFNGRVYDGCCGSGGMFVQSEKFVEEHQGNIKDLSIYGQESNPTTLRLAKMNLAIRGIDAKIELGDTFLNDKHKDLKADFILANPPFNISDWSGEQLRDDIRWKYGVPPTGNANYAWLQHFIYKLSPTGTAGIVLANGSMNSNTGNEGEIRKNLVESGLIDCMVSLPTQLFFNTQIPACLWFLARNKTNGRFRNRSNEVLFIDARKMGKLVNRRNKELTDKDLNLIADIYHQWRNPKSKYKDIDGFCKSATMEEIKHNGFVLMPGKYVGTEEEAFETFAFQDRLKLINENLKAHTKSSNKLDEIIRNNLGQLFPEYDWNGINFSSSAFLEYITKTIFKEWFVDYNFPNAKGKMQPTEIGEIPVGWKVETFESVFDAERGLSYKGAGLANSDAMPMHNLNSIFEGGGYKTAGIKYYNGDFKDKHLVFPGDLIIANTEQGHKYMLIGFPAIVSTHFGEKGIFSHHIYRLRPKKDCYLTSDFIYHLLLQQHVRDQVIGFANGTTVNMLKIEGLRKPKFAMPPQELTNKFAALAKAIRLKTEENIKQTQTPLHYLTPYYPS